MFIEAELERDLRLHAGRLGRSTASVVREALAQWVDAQRAAPTARPGFVATGRSGHADTAERAEELVFGSLDPHGARAGRQVRAPRQARRSPNAPRRSRSR
jgi:hypothetical protein